MLYQISIAAGEQGVARELRGAAGYIHSIQLQN